MKTCGCKGTTQDLQWESIVCCFHPTVIFFIFNGPTIMAELSLGNDKWLQMFAYPYFYITERVKQRMMMQHLVPNNKKWL